MLGNKGMATLEVCVIIPISLTIIMMLVMMGIYLYDRNVLDQAASRAAIVGSQNSELDNGEIADIVMRKMREITEGKLVLLGDPQVQVSVGFSEIQVDVDAHLNLPESIFMGRIYNKRSWSFFITQKAARLHPSMFVRTVSRLSKGLVSPE